VDTNLVEVGAPTLRGLRAPNDVCYRQVRSNVISLLSSAAPGTAVPACPEWTVRDLVAHLAGVAALSIGEQASPDGMDLPELLFTWDQLGPEVDAMLAGHGGQRGNLLVMDAFTHELDVRYAIGTRLPAEHPAFAGAFEVLAAGFAAAVEDHGLPAVRLSTESTQWMVGPGDPAATVTATRYDIFRSLAGRRTHRQITDLDWDRDSHRWLPAFTWGPFTPPPSPVERGERLVERRHRRSHRSLGRVKAVARAHHQ
jgi:uncharacterized protein (TIGR03083 family)